MDEKLALRVNRYRRHFKKSLPNLLKRHHIEYKTYLKMNDDEKTAVKEKCLMPILRVMIKTCFDNIKKEEEEIKVIETLMMIEML